MVCVPGCVEMRPRKRAIRHDLTWLLWEQTAKQGNNAAVRSRVCMHVCVCD